MIVRSAVATLLVALTAVSTAPASAQTVRGTVLDTLSGAPVTLGFVVLLDSVGREVGRTLSRSDGRFTIRPPGPGHYQLRSERIGFRVSVSPFFGLTSDETLEYALWVSALPIELSGIDVEVEDRCQVDPREGVSTATLWEEARKALVAASWSAAQQLNQYTFSAYEREWDVGRRRVRREKTSTKSGFYSAPYRSLPPERLAREGYVVSDANGTWFYAPDADVFLDDSFLATHCFKVTREPYPYENMVGLGFEPVPGRSLPDITGVLWLDERSSELRVLEYRYTGLARPLGDHRLGGTVEFMPLLSGVWIVHRWQIRTPIVRSRRESRDLMIFWRRLELTGFLDVGGQILEVSDFDGRRMYTADLVLLTGTVFDSTRSTPLAGVPVSTPMIPGVREQEGGVALSGVVLHQTEGIPIESVEVRVEPLAMTTWTAEDGGFELAHVPRGRHELVLRRAGYVSRRFAFELGQDTGAVVVGAIGLIPAGEGELTCRCTVRDAMSGEPLPAARIQIDGTTIGISDPDGLIETAVMLPIGPHVMETKAIGHRPDTQLINMTAPAVDIELDITVEPTPYRLESIVVVGERLVRKLAPFYFRRVASLGRFLGPADIEELMPTIRSTTELLARVPGVLVNAGNVIRMARSRPDCTSPALYIDNAPILGITRDSLFSVDMLIDPIHILAIEVYRGPSEAPLEFGSSVCGVIVIWTR